MAGYIYDKRERPDEAQWIIGQLQDDRFLSVDTETTGLEWRDRLFCATISTEHDDFYFDKEDIHDLDHIFADPARIWIMQNAPFDLRMLRHAGVELAGTLGELQVAARLVRNDGVSQKWYSLALQAKRHGWEKYTIVEDEIQKKKLYEIRTPRIGQPEKQPRYDWVDRKILQVYAMHDTRLTRDLCKKYISQFDMVDGNHAKVWNNECSLTRVVFEMEWRGIGLDIPYTRGAMDHEQAKLDKLYREFHASSGIEYVDSGQTFEKVFTKYGMPIVRTPKGNPSFTDEVLEKYDHPVAEAIRAIRSSEKMISTYYRNMLNLYEPLSDTLGVIRPSMWQAGTRTGRFSYSNPNLQNLPKEEDSKEKYVTRGCFVPRPGKCFLSLDYSQQEYRLMLAYANEKAVIEQVMAGMDVHQATADLLGISRSYAKTLNFAILYGAGIEKIARMLKCSKQEAKRLKLLYFMKLPNVERFIDQVIRTGRARGFVHNWFGRRLYADKEFCYALPNHLIQGGGADVCKVAMVRIGPDAPMVAQIHDQLIFEEDFDDNLPEKAARYKQIMEDAFPEKNGIRLKVDVSWSKTSLAERDMEELIL